MHNDCDFSLLLETSLFGKPESIFLIVEGIPLVGILGANRISSFVFHFFKKVSNSQQSLSE
jgi:hypothetical protein